LVTVAGAPALPLADALLVEVLAGADDELDELLQAEAATTVAASSMPKA
jgi:hypothetical protein